MARVRCSVLATLPLAVLPVSTAFIQTAQSPPAFEVASVKPAPPQVGDMATGCSHRNPSLLHCTNMPLWALVWEAYGVKRYQIEGPSWMNSERYLYNVDAKVPRGTSRDQVAAMWQTLLAERFQLAVHRETRLLPVYELSVAKEGTKLKAVDPAELKNTAKTRESIAAALPPPPRPPAGGAPEGGSLMATGSVGGPILGMRTTASGSTAVSGKGTIPQLIGMLARAVDRPIVDATGLTGIYHIELAYLASESSSLQAAGVGGDVNRLPDASTPIATVFQAVQAMGLKLEPKKSPTDMIVIDHAEKVPVENWRD